LDDKWEELFDKWNRDWLGVADVLLEVEGVVRLVAYVELDCFAE
jgi:hypothetical protein